MKKHVYLYFSSIILLAILGVSSQAQSRSRQQLRVNVPFAFNVGNTVLPAGEYRVNIVNPSSDLSVLLIASSDGKSKTMVKTTDVRGWATAKAKLSFRHYGSHYFLAQVWMSGEQTGLATPSSSAERAIRRQLGNANKKNDVVAVNVR
jgi:hypothetical protein